MHRLCHVARRLAAAPARLLSADAAPSLDLDAIVEATQARVAA